MAENMPTTIPAPYLSNTSPTTGEITAAKTPPRLTAPANSARVHPNCSDIGTTNTVSTATDISGRAEYDTIPDRPSMIQP